MDERQMRAAERAHDSHEKFVLQTQQAAVDTGVAFLKNTLLINGGATIAIIAFLGTLMAQDKVTATQFRDVAWSLLWFANGVFFSVVSLGLGYWTNYTTQGHAVSLQPTYEHPYFQPTATTATWNHRKNICTGLCFLAGMISIVLFIVGVYAVYDALWKLRG